MRSLHVRYCSWAADCAQGGRGFPSEPSGVGSCVIASFIPLRGRRILRVESIAGLEKPELLRRLNRKRLEFRFLLRTIFIEPTILNLQEKFRQEWPGKCSTKRGLSRPVTRVARLCLRRGRGRISVIHAGVAAGSGTTDESQEAELSSSTVAPGAQDRGFSTETRTFSITVCGITNDNDLRRLKSQVEDIDGVRHAWLGPLKEGGVRGHSLSVHIEVEKRVLFPALIQSIQALDEDLLILPFKSNSWLWRGHKINYSVTGCGQPLILIHGFGGNVGHFARLTPFLAENRRVYAIDLLGFGASDKPSDTEYGPEIWAELVCDFAKEFAGEGSVLFGNSIGSLCVLAASAKAGSDLFKGVVLLNCAGAMNRKGLSQDSLVLRFLTPIFIAVEYLLQQPKVAYFLFNRFRSKNNVKQILQQQAYRDKEAVTDQLVDILHHPSSDEGALDVFVKVFTGEPGQRPEVMVPKINVPILVLWGEEDPWTPANGPIAKYFKRVAVERENVFVRILPDVGHCPHDDRPELAAGEILPFLDKYNF